MLLTVAQVSFILSLTASVLFALWRKPVPLIAVTLAMVVGVVCIRIDPTWDDNGSIETISWSETPAWASLYAGLIELGVWPALAVVMWWRRRSRSS